MDEWRGVYCLALYKSCSFHLVHEFPRCQFTLFLKVSFSGLMRCYHEMALCWIFVIHGRWLFVAVDFPPLFSSIFGLKM
uniref:Uncharacterized protein n=1 Tax=Hordeum vulgare subsp. vulgare TaxID=112509 RepID=A0A8I7B455_HORVV